MEPGNVARGGVMRNTELEKLDGRVGEWTTLYQDDRGVCRQYAMTFDGTH